MLLVSRALAAPLPPAWKQKRGGRCSGLTSLRGRPNTRAHRGKCLLKLLAWKTMQGSLAHVLGRCFWRLPTDLTVAQFAPRKSTSHQECCLICFPAPILRRLHCPPCHVCQMEQVLDICLRSLLIHDNAARRIESRSKLTHLDSMRWAGVSRVADTIALYTNQTAHACVHNGVGVRGCVHMCMCMDLCVWVRL